ncbi:LPS export ABC transporter ATP-binding protein [Devosia naphthalenivorans]|uniref:LPS export ABC transporter ATP-binding protein n=1 Tax=Devosia naphthalenivorans TaxID=2082392 RepID=UPI003CCC30D2
MQSGRSAAASDRQRQGHQPEWHGGFQRTGGQSRHQCFHLHLHRKWPGDRGVHVPMSEAPAKPRIDQTGWLVAHSLAKSFGKRVVVRDVSIAVRRGEAVGLLGPNGAGKTTVFTMIMGLVKPDHGAISLDGRAITHLPLFQRGRLGIGYLPQEPSIFRGLSVSGNILAVLENHIRNKTARMARLQSLLEEFSIEHLANANALALSGGERRRVEIARALAADPVFMLLDEPFAGVDPIAVAEVKGLVKQLTQRGIGVLITDHAVRETLGLVDRAYVIHGGKVMIQGRPETISADPDARRVYLGENFEI